MCATLQKYSLVLLPHTHGHAPHYIIWACVPPNMRWPCFKLWNIKLGNDSNSNRTCRRDGWVGQSKCRYCDNNRRAAMAELSCYLCGASTVDLVATLFGALGRLAHASYAHIGRQRERTYSFNLRSAHAVPRSPALPGPRAPVGSCDESRP